jgi:hypothetical protein
MHDRNEFEAFAYEYRRKAESIDRPVVREIWNMVADRWSGAAARGEQQALARRPADASRTD